MLEVLAEVGFVRVVSKGKTIETVIPDIPIFEDIYDDLGSYASTELRLNEHEQATIQILSSLYEAPRNRDSLLAKSGIEKIVFDRCVRLGAHSGILTEQTARGKSILISPFFFFK